jgi:hypothetical protein
MPLNTVTTGNTILATDVNQLVNVLQRAAGQTEVGDYYLTSFATTSGQSMGTWVGTLSRGATPVSVGIDTSLQAVSGCNAPSTDHLNSNGFHVFTSSTGAVGAMNVGGQYTVQY